MKRIVYYDPEMLPLSLAGPVSNPDPDVVEAVSDAIGRLDPDQRDMIRDYYFSGLKIRAMALKYGITEREIRKSIYDAKRQLKIILSEFARNRWNVAVAGLCRICSHHKRTEIERILKSKKRNETWKKTAEKIKFETGESFHPPQVLKAHLNHIEHKGDENERG